MFRIFIFLLVLTSVNAVSTQTIYQRLPYDYIWLFNGSRIDFNYAPPLVTADDQPMPFEGTNASICDEDGQLLVYTNGIYLAGSDGDTLINGGGLNPGVYTDNRSDNGYVNPQTALALPTFDKINLLHLPITQLDSLNDNGDILIVEKILVSEIDILGTSVLSKNKVVVENAFNSTLLTAVRHGNGSDWLAIMPRYFSDKYATIMVTPDTVQYLGEQSIGISVPSGLGQAAFSPRGDKYAKLDLYTLTIGTISIFDFDRCSGQLSNPIQIAHQDTAFTGGLAFSENGRFLYISSFRFVYQYDLEAEDIPATKTIIATPQLPSSKVYYMAQLAPDGKIYLCTQGSSDSLHVIHSPNRRGHACDFEHLGQPLPAVNRRTMPNYPYYGLGPWDGSPCDTLNIDNPVPEARYEHTQDSSALQLEFFDASHYAYEWSWDFGDGSIGLPSMVAQHPIHTYSEIGTYEVCLTVSNVTGNDTYCETIQIGPVGTQEIFAPGVAVKVWPNPVDNEPLYFQISGFDKKNTIYLYLRDSQGRLILKDTFPVTGGTNQHQLNIDHLPPGLYFYELYGQRPLASGKVVIIP